MSLMVRIRIRALVVPGWFDGLHLPIALWPVDSVSVQVNCFGQTRVAGVTRAKLSEFVPAPGFECAVLEDGQGM
jgi:hypothetical protein